MTSGGKKTLMKNDEFIVQVLIEDVCVTLVVLGVCSKYT